MVFEFQHHQLTEGLNRQGQSPETVLLILWFSPNRSTKEFQRKVDKHGISIDPARSLKALGVSFLLKRRRFYRKMV